MKAFEILRDSGPARLITSLLTALLVTSATFLPFLIQGATASPVAIALPQPESAPQPGPQSTRDPTLDGYYPEPEQCRGNCSWIHDPSIYYENGTYWRFSTSGNIAIATAPSIGGPWRYQGALLHQGTSISVVNNQDIWAPTVSKRGDTYYCFYSVSSLGLQNSSIGVATSLSLSPGTWFDHGSIHLPLSPKYNLIDPYVYQETPTSPTYFTFGSFWDDIFQIELFPHDNLLDFGRWAADNNRITNIIRNSSMAATVVEGAIMHKYEEHYYMFFSVGWCCNTPENGLAAPGDVYHVAVCRANVPTGPFYDQEGKDCKEENGGTTVLRSHGDVYAPGGQGVIVHPEDGRTVMYYHYVKPSIGYEAQDFFFGWNYVDWEEGWPVLVGT